MENNKPKVGAAFFNEDGKLIDAVVFNGRVAQNGFDQNGNEQLKKMPRNTQDTLIDWRNLSFIKDYENKIPENAKTIELIEDYCREACITPQELIDFHKHFKL